MLIFTYTLQHHARTKINDALYTHIGTVHIGGRIIINLRFADDIDGLAGSKSELNSIIRKIDFAHMECRLTQKNTIMTNSKGKFTSEIKINNEPLKIVDTFK